MVLDLGIHKMGGCIGVGFIGWSIDGWQESIEMRDVLFNIAFDGLLDLNESTYLFNETLTYKVRGPAMRPPPPGIPWLNLAVDKCRTLSRLLNLFGRCGLISTVLIMACGLYASVLTMPCRRPAPCLKFS